MAPNLSINLPARRYRKAARRLLLLSAGALAISPARFSLSHVTPVTEAPGAYQVDQGDVDASIAWVMAAVTSGLALLALFMAKKHIQHLENQLGDQQVHDSQRSFQIQAEEDSQRKTSGSKSSQDKLCPKCCHAPLKAAETPFEGWYCSVCKETAAKGSLLHGCRSCDYDECSACFGQGKLRAILDAEQKTGAVAPGLPASEVKQLAEMRATQLAASEAQAKLLEDEIRSMEAAHAEALIQINRDMHGVHESQVEGIKTVFQRQFERDLELTIERHDQDLARVQSEAQWKVASEAAATIAGLKEQADAAAAAERLQEAKVKQMQAELKGHRDQETDAIQELKAKLHEKEAELANLADSQTKLHLREAELANLAESHADGRQIQAELLLEKEKELAKLAASHAEVVRTAQEAQTIAAKEVEAAEAARIEAAQDAASILQLLDPGSQTQVAEAAQQFDISGGDSGDEKKSSPRTGSLNQYASSFRAFPRQKKSPPVAAIVEAKLRAMEQELAKSAESHADVLKSVYEAQTTATKEAEAAKLAKAQAVQEAEVKLRAKEHELAEMAASHTKMKRDFQTAEVLRTAKASKAADLAKTELAKQAKDELHVKEQELMKLKDSHAEVLQMVDEQKTKAAIEAERAELAKAEVAELHVKEQELMKLKESHADILLMVHEQKTKATSEAERAELAKAEQAQESEAADVARAAAAKETEAAQLATDSLNRWIRKSEQALTAKDEEVASLTKALEEKDEALSQDAAKEAEAAKQATESLNRWVRQSEKALKAKDEEVSTLTNALEAREEELSQELSRCQDVLKDNEGTLKDKDEQLSQAMRELQDLKKEVQEFPNQLAVAERKAKLADEEARSLQEHLNKTEAKLHAQKLQAKVSSTQAEELKLVFEPGKVGIGAERNGLVKSVFEGEQAHGLGVCKGMRVLTVGGEPYTEERFNAARLSSDSYEVTFAQVDVAASYDAFVKGKDKMKPEADGTCNESSPEASHPPPPKSKDPGSPSEKIKEVNFQESGDATASKNKSNKKSGSKPRRR